MRLPAVRRLHDHDGDPPDLQARVSWWESVPGGTSDDDRHSCWIQWMTIREVRIALVRRLKRPTIAWAVLTFYLLYIAADSPRWFGNLRHPGDYYDTFGSMALLLGGFAWLAPIPWQWDGLVGGTPSLRRGAIQAFLFIEGLVGLQMVLTWLNYRWMGRPFPQGYISYNIAVTAPLMMIIGSLVAIREHEERKKQLAEEDARMARTRLLQSQLHPHVLFNALNGVAELILKDPPAAERTVRNLSDLLRQLLDVSETGTIPLGEERMMVENYLAIESMRLGDRLDLQWEWAEGLDGIEVIPLLLQPLVENAIKHGVAPHEEGGKLRIRARSEGQALILEVWNSGEALGAPKARKGIGLKNLRARLAAAYAGAASFTLEGRDGGVSAVISIDLSRGHGIRGHAEGSHR
ncbi:MAG: histidine kinase [Holophagaceae bacterium]